MEINFNYGLIANTDNAVCTYVVYCIHYFLLFCLFCFTHFISIANGGTMWSFFLFYFYCLYRVTSNSIFSNKSFVFVSVFVLYSELYICLPDCCACVSLFLLFFAT